MRRGPPSIAVQHLTYPLVLARAVMAGQVREYKPERRGPGYRALDHVQPYVGGEPIDHQVPHDEVIDIPEMDVALRFVVGG